jgi:hypothetical protein
MDSTQREHRNKKQSTKWKAHKESHQYTQQTNTLSCHLKTRKRDTTKAEREINLDAYN